MKGLKGITGNLQAIIKLSSSRRVAVRLPSGGWGGCEPKGTSEDKELPEEQWESRAVERITRAHTIGVMYCSNPSGTSRVDTA